MKTKIVKDYTYTGFIFPVELDEVEMVYYGGEWHPKLDILKLSEQVIEKLAFKSYRLTGDEIRFIRAHYGMSMRLFAEEVAHETHSAVQKWEARKDQETNMNKNTELAIRNYIIEQLLNPEEKLSPLYTRTTRARKFLTKKDNASTVLHISECKPENKAALN